MKQLKSLLSLFFITVFILTGCGQNSEDEFAYTETDTTQTDITYSSVNAYTSLEKAQTAIGFAFLAPSNIPTGYTQDEISVINDNGSKIAQIDYKKEDYNLTYRVSQTTDTLNSDRNTYDKEKVIVIGEKEITCACNQDIIFVATWQNDSCYYCIMSDEGLNTATISAMIYSIQ